MRGLSGFITVRRESALRTGALLSGALLLVAVAVELFASVAFARTIVDFFVLVSVVVALQVFVGQSGIVSFGHAAFFGLGAYAAAIASADPESKQSLTALPQFVRDMELGLLATLGLSALVCLIIMAIVAWPLSRMEESALAMSTLAVLVLFHSTFVNWGELTRGTRGFTGIPRLTTLWSAVAVSIGIVIIACCYRGSASGMRVQAAREDPVASRSLGINVERERFRSLVLSGTLTGLGGAVWALNSLSFGPDSFYFGETFARLSMLVIGGMMSVSGAIAGVAIVLALEEWVSAADAGISFWIINIERTEGIVQIAVAAAMLLTLLFRPSGLFGTGELGGWNKPVLRRAKRGNEGGAEQASAEGAGGSVSESAPATAEHQDRAVGPER